MSPGGRHRAVLVVFVFVVNDNEKTVTFSYESFLLHINHYLKNHFHQNPRRFFLSRLFRERGAVLDLPGVSIGLPLLFLSLLLMKMKKPLRFAMKIFRFT